MFRGRAEHKCIMRGGCTLGAANTFSVWSQFRKNRPPSRSSSALKFYIMLPVTTLSGTMDIKVKYLSFLECNYFSEISIYSFYKYSSNALLFPGTSRKEVATVEEVFNEIREGCVGIKGVCKLSLKIINSSILLKILP